MIAITVLGSIAAPILASGDACANNIADAYAEYAKAQVYYSRAYKECMSHQPACSDDLAQAASYMAQASSDMYKAIDSCGDKGSPCSRALAGTFDDLASLSTDIGEMAKVCNYYDKDNYDVIECIDAHSQVLKDQITYAQDYAAALQTCMGGQVVAPGFPTEFNTTIDTSVDSALSVRGTLSPFPAHFNSTALPGPYTTASKTVTVGGYVCGGSQQAVVYYPTNHAKSPLLSFSHGLNVANVAYAYGTILNSLASYGYVVIAALSAPKGYCNYQTADQIHSLEWVKTSEFASYVDWSKPTGVFGHSMGGGATHLSAQNQAAVKANNIGAAMALHPVYVAGGSYVPIFYGTGSKDTVYARTPHSRPRPRLSAASDTLCDASYHARLLARLAVCTPTSRCGRRGQTRSACLKSSPTLMARTTMNHASCRVAGPDSRPPTLAATCIRSPSRARPSMATALRIRARCATVTSCQ